MLSPHVQSLAVWAEEHQENQTPIHTLSLKMVLLAFFYIYLHEITQCNYKLKWHKTLIAYLVCEGNSMSALIWITDRIHRDNKSYNLLLVRFIQINDSQV